MDDVCDRHLESLTFVPLCHVIIILANLVTGLVFLSDGQHYDSLLVGLGLSGLGVCQRFSTTNVMYGRIGSDDIDSVIGQMC